MNRSFGFLSHTPAQPDFFSPHFSTKLDYVWHDDDDDDDDVHWIYCLLLLELRNQLVRNL
jgi:hypothetical protein